MHFEFSRCLVERASIYVTVPHMNAANVHCSKDLGEQSFVVYHVCLKQKSKAGIKYLFHGNVSTFF